MSRNQQQRDSARPRRRPHPPSPQAAGQQDRPRAPARQNPTTDGTGIRSDIDLLQRRYMEDRAPGLAESLALAREQAIDEANGDAPFFADRQARHDYIRHILDRLRDQMGSAGAGRSTAAGEPGASDSDSDALEIADADGARMQQADGWTLVDMRPQDIDNQGRSPRRPVSMGRVGSTRLAARGGSARMRTLRLPPFLEPEEQMRQYRDLERHLDEYSRARDAGRSSLETAGQRRVYRNLERQLDDYSRTQDFERSLFPLDNEYMDELDERSNAADMDIVDTDSGALNTPGMAVDVLDWFQRSFDPSAQRLSRRQASLTRRQRADMETVCRRGTGPAHSVIVRQAWNRERKWKPYIYQEPSTHRNPWQDNLHDHLGQRAAVAEGSNKRHNYAIHSGVSMLSLACTNADDMGNGSLSNMFTPNTDAYVTSRAANVHLELAFTTDPVPENNHHRVVERIMVMSSHTLPCAELMVFASSRRCTFSEFRKYNRFTFAQYEQLAAKIEHQGASATTLSDPLPIAYFWLTAEDEYEQLQVLPQGISCKYLYVKLLRGPVTDQKMSLLLIRAYGWDGTRSFSEAALC
ncbi:hypothetical protein GGF46_000408 [Coemansia sp. RSA 552]|nr:hypothetical protein GGF46_000408 [Coemansia sp. RSA 552]